MPEEIKPETSKSIKITDQATRAIEAYLGWQRGIGVEMSKQDVLEEAVLFFVGSKMPSVLLRIYGIEPAPRKGRKELAR
jgi:hypothetical protein